jgi:hypothetical protein
LDQDHVAADVTEAFPHRVALPAWMVLEHDRDPGIRREALHEPARFVRGVALHHDDLELHPGDLDAEHGMQHLGDRLGFVEDRDDDAERHRRYELRET